MAIVPPADSPCDAVRLAEVPAPSVAAADDEDDVEEDVVEVLAAVVLGVDVDDTVTIMVSGARVLPSVLETTTVDVKSSVVGAKDAPVWVTTTTLPDVVGVAPVMVVAGAVVFAVVAAAVAGVVVVAATAAGVVVVDAAAAVVAAAALAEDSALLITAELTEALTEDATAEDTDAAEEEEEEAAAAAESVVEAGVVAASVDVTAFPLPTVALERVTAPVLVENKATDIEEVSVEGTDTAAMVN